MNIKVDISNVVLKTERLILRPFKEDDLDDLFEYAKVDGVGQMAGWLPHKDKDESKMILEMFINEKKTFAIEYNNKVIGSFGIEKYDEKVIPEYQDKKGCELGFVLSKDYWGQELIKETAGEVIAYLFEKENIDFITCCHFVDNNQSKRVQEKLGFKEKVSCEMTARYGLVKDSIMSIIEKIIIDDEIELVPYYPKYELTLDWYQDLDLVKQVDNKDRTYDLQLLKQMYDYLTINGYCYYIKYKGKLVGDITLKYDGDMAIVISKPYQNKHIGRRCIKGLIKLAEQKNINTLKAEIYSFNKQSQKMFESVGFKQIADELYEYKIKAMN